MNNLNNYRVLMFDFDGTMADMIIDWDEWLVGVYKIMKMYDPSLEVENIDEVENLQNAFIQKYGEKFWYEITEFSNKYEIEKCINIKPNLKLLEFVKNTSKKVIVWTNNGSFFVKKYLQKVGLDKKIELVVGREMVRLIKPNPEGFFKYIENKSVNLKDYVFIGNDLDNDKVGAMSAGIEFVHIDEFCKNILKL